MASVAWVSGTLHHDMLRHKTMQHSMLQQEARGLLTRLARVRPFALVESMLTAAAPLPRTQSAVDGYLLQGRKRLLEQVHEYLRWLESEEGQRASPEAAQRRF